MTKVLEIIEKIKIAEEGQEELDQLYYSVARQRILYKIWISDAMEYLQKAAKTKRYSKSEEKELIEESKNLYSFFDEREKKK